MKPFRFILLLLLLFPVTSGAAELTVLFTGDTYGFHGREGLPGGFAKRKKAIDRIKQSGRSVILIDNGNALGQSYYSRFDQGALAAELMGRLKYDAWNLGVHDFDYGPARILELQKRHQLPALSSNVTTEAGEPFVSKAIQLNRNGIRVAILGICDPQVDQKTIAGKFSGLKSEEPLTALKEQTKKLREEADLLILLANVGYFSAEKLIQELPQFDLVVSRESDPDTYEHEEEKVPEHFTIYWSDAAKGKRTGLLPASRYGYRLGRVDLKFAREGSGWSLSQMKPSFMDLSADTPEDLAIQERVGGHVATLKEWYGESLVTGIREHWGHSINADDFLKLFVSLMRDKARAEVGILNQTFFSKEKYTWEQIQKRDALYEYDLQRLIWVEDHLIKGIYTGEQLQKVYEEGRGVLLFAGLTQKEDKFFINGRPLQKKERYSIATAHYLILPQTPVPSMRNGIFYRTEFLEKNGRLVSHQLGRTVILRDFFIAEAGELFSYSREKEFVPQWRFDVREINATVSHLDVRNNQNFTAVSDARVQATDLFTIGILGRFQLVYDHELFAWKNGLEGRFERIELPGNVINIPHDNLFVFEQIDIKKRHFRVGHQHHLYPFGQAAYETQFAPPTGVARRQIVRVSPGLTTTWNGIFQEMQLGPSVEIDLSRADTNLAYGAAYHHRFLRSVTRGGILYQSDVDVRYFPLRETERADSLTTTADFQNRLQVPLVRDLYLTPRVDFFLYHSKFLGETGNNLFLGLGFTYARLWKPGTEKFFY